MKLSTEFPGVDLTPWLSLVTCQGTLVTPKPLDEPVCSDPDDDKFLACALACGARIVVSGDRALLRTTGYQGITVLTPRHFIEEYLSSHQ